MLNRQYHKQFSGHFFQDLSSKVDILDIWGPGHGVQNPLSLLGFWAGTLDYDLYLGLSITKVAIVPVVMEHTLVGIIISDIK